MPGLFDWLRNKKSPQAPATEQTLAQEAGLPDNWVPIDSDPIVPGQAPAPGKMDFSSGPLPPNFGSQSPALLGTSYPDKTGPISLFPVAGNANANAKAEGIANTVAKQLISQIPVTPPATAVTDGITHGQNNVNVGTWESDPAYFLLRDDFTHVQLGSSVNVPVTNIGQLGWNLNGNAGTPAHGAVFGGIPPYIGQYWWENDGTINQYNWLSLQMNGTNQSNSGNNCGWALFDNPGWVASYVFRVGSCSPNLGVQYNFGKKSVYVGMAGTSFTFNSSVNATARPDTFFGVRYDTSGPQAGTATTYTATAVTQSGNNMVLAGTFAGANQIAGTSWVGLWFTTSGFSAGGNNGTFVCTAATPTSLTLTNPNGVTAATGGSVNGTTPLVLTAAANGSGTSVVYTGTITGGGTNNYVGQMFFVSGFGNAGNNGGPWKCLANSTTTITLANTVATGSAETHAGYTMGPVLEDTTFVLEAVQNPSYGAVGRNNTQGQTLNTGIAPVVGVWHRLDIYCNKTGSITIVFDGSTTNTLVAKVSPVTITTGVAGLTGTVADSQLTLSWVLTAGSIPQNLWATGSQVTVTGFGGTQAGFNNAGSPWTVLDSYGTTAFAVDYPAATTVASNSVVGTLTGYPAIIPLFIMGNTNDSTAAGASTMTFWVDFFSMLWNPNLGLSAPGVPAITKPRYF